MKSRIVPLLCCFTGALLIGGGIWAIASYLQAVAADMSMLFWALVIAGLGVGLLGVGVGFLVLARRSWDGDASTRALARNALLGLCLLFVALLVMGHLRLQRIQDETRAFEQDAAMQTDLERRARKLGQLDVEAAGGEALLVRTQPTPGLDGRYRWTLRVSSNEATLFQSSRVLSLQGATPPIAQRLRFDELFAACFGATPVKAYACVRNAGAGDLYTVEGQLELMDGRIDGGVATDAIRTPHPVIRSSRATQLTLDTRTSNDAVTVLGVE
jgi:hypothetical protein